MELVGLASPEKVEYSGLLAAVVRVLPVLPPVPEAWRNSHQLKVQFFALCRSKIPSFFFTVNELDFDTRYNFFLKHDPDLYKIGSFEGKEKSFFRV